MRQDCTENRLANLIRGVPIDENMNYVGGFFNLLNPYALIGGLASLTLFTLHGANWWTRLWKLQLPAALPSIFTGLRIGAGLCVVGALVADFFFTRGDLGLGRLLNNYGQELRYELLFGGVILASLFGVLIYAFISWLSNRMLRSWHESESGQS